jgi:DNA-binding PadR family transcriptional regulator
MPIHHAVLGLLADGPSHGYELKGTFEQAIGPQWGDLNIGHLYQVLDRLTRDGLVARRDVPQRDRPDKVIYRLTKAGQGELDRWLDAPAARPAGYRDDFFLKLFAASRQAPARVREVAQIQRQACIGELAVLSDLRKGNRGDPLVSLLVEAALEHTKASLRIAELAEDKAEDLVQSVEHRKGVEQSAVTPARGRASSK